MSTLTLEQIDMASFEDGYKECFAELIEAHESGRTDQIIEILFDSEGKFTGHLWGQNCSYSEEDMKINGDYHLDEVEWELGLKETIEGWEDEVRIDIA